MATFSYSTALPPYKSPVTSGRLRTLYTDLKTHINTFNPQGWTLPNVAASQYQALLYNTGLAFSLSHVFRSDAAVNFSGAASLAQGDILYFNGTNLTRLGAGTTGQFLRTNGAGANPSWVTAIPLTDGDKGDITVASSGTSWTIDSGVVTQSKLGFTVTTRTTTANATVNEYILADTSSAAWTLTFPASATAGDKIFVVDLKNTFDTNNLTIARNGLKIENQSTDLVINIKGFIAMFYYVDATIGWKRI